MKVTRIIFRTAALLLALPGSSIVVRAQPLGGVLDGMKLLLLGNQEYSLDRHSRATSKPRDQQQSSSNIHVIGAGLPRTGTGSLHQALEILGYKTYHMVIVMEDSSHAKLWADVAKGQETTDAAFAAIAQVGFNATLDWPTSDMFQDQIRLYPEAKVVLSIRDDAAAWARSFSTLTRLIRALDRPFSWKFPNPLPLIFPTHSENMHTLRCATGKVVLGWNRCEQLAGKQWLESGFLEEQYQKHVDLVKTQVSHDQLLIFNVKEGWGPLCRFLELAVPDVPFPRVGDTAMLERSAVTFQACVHIWIPLLLAMLYALYCMMGFSKKVKIS